LFLLPLIIFLSGAWPSSAAGAGEVSKFRLSQAVVQPPQITAYLEILDAQDTLAPVEPQQVNAALGSTRATVENLKPFSPEAEGVAYILLVDISKSLSPKEFAQMRQVLNDWIESMSAMDRAAIITLGTEVKTVQEFTNRKDLLKGWVASLSPTDSHTQLHQGLIRAQELGRRLDPGLPLRRAILLLSDGRDDFAGGATRQEVLEVIKVDPVPIYAIGFYPPPRNQKKEDGLKALGEFARLSGGAYFRAETADFQLVYGQMDQAIKNVYTVKLTCPTCQWDGAVRRLQMDFTAGPTAMRTGMDIRLASLPPSPPPGTGRESPGGGGSAGDDDKAPPPPVGVFAAVMLFLASIPWWGYVGVALLLTGVIVALVLMLRDPSPHLSMESPAWRREESPTPGRPVWSGPEPAATVALKPPEKGLGLRLTVIRGQEGAGPFEKNLVDKLVIGRQDSCDLVIKGDQEASRKHCQLSREGEAVRISDLGSRNGTLVNGVPISGPYLLKSDDIIQVGGTELRLTIIKEI
jgi:hypothetical protein